MEPSSAPRLVVSVVSHGQAALLAHLWADLASVCRTPIHVVLTLNKPESPPLVALPFPITVITNAKPQGFAANHNAAAHVVPSDVFCVLNPDVRLTKDPFPRLLEALRDPKVGVVAPRVVGSDGKRQDSARPLPTPWGTVKRYFGGVSEGPLDGEIEWVAGMFMVFRSATFQAQRGFDARYFLYYEDCELCCRLRLAGLRIAVCEDVVVVHDAQRTSHRRPRYLFWHVKSALRFFCSPVYRALRADRHAPSAL